MGKKEQIAAKITTEIRALTAGTRLGVAVSGGGDSMALLAIASMAGLDLSAATVDHGLRPEASDEAGLVADFCRSSGIPHQTLRIPPLPDFGNISAAARTARYAALTAWAAKQDLTTVLLGHTRDDQAETVLLRLARGSGVDGLSAMSAVRHSHGLTWVRPMLAIARAELRDWLIDQGISWADDPTNDDASFDRVRVRQAMDALWPLGITSDRLVGTADILATQRLVLEDAASQLSVMARRDGAYGDIRLSREHLAAARRDTSLRLLKRAITDVSGADYPPRHRSIDKVLDDILADTPAQTLGGCMLWTDGEDLVICREPAATKTAPIKPGQQTWDGRWAVTAPEKVDALWIGSLGDLGLQAAPSMARVYGSQPTEDWQNQPRILQKATPAVFANEMTSPESLVAIPCAGVFFADQAKGIDVRLSAPGDAGAQS